MTPLLALSLLEGQVTSTSMKDVILTSFVVVMRLQNLGSWAFNEVVSKKIFLLMWIAREENT